MRVDVELDTLRDQFVVHVRLENGYHHTEYVSMSDLSREPVYVHAEPQPAQDPPKTDADKAIDDAIERSKPVEKPLSWEERLKKELNEGVDTWGRIAKKHKHAK